jgi:putative acetyltransferase
MTQYRIIKKAQLDEKETIQLLRVWESSVRATHKFLTEENITSLKPLVKTGVLHVAHVICVEDDKNEIQAFMGIDGDKIEMLFVSPIMRGKGIGKRLIAYAVDEMKIKFVDVNEQNEQAVGFYEHLGFKVFERSELDEQGNPFPILHMKYNKIELPLMK